MGAILRDLWRDANARAVFVIDRNGMELSSAGEVSEFDSTSLASLAAGNVAATDGLAKLIGEREFSVLFHEGRHDHIHISVVAGHYILLVIFDDRSSLGLVRLRVRQAMPRIETLFESIHARQQAEARPDPSPQVVIRGSVPAPGQPARPPSVPASVSNGPVPALADGVSSASPFSKITDEDIEALFGE